jgi:hypothetical protein
MCRAGIRPPDLRASSKQNAPRSRGAAAPTTESGSARLDKEQPGGTHVPRVAQPQRLCRQAGRSAARPAPPERSHELPRVQSSQACAFPDQFAGLPATATCQSANETKPLNKQVKNSILTTAAVAPIMSSHPAMMYTLAAELEQPYMAPELCRRRDQGWAGTAEIGRIRGNHEYRVARGILHCSGAS